MTKMATIPATITNGMTLHKAKVIVDIIKRGNIEIRPGTLIVPKYITYHNTGNKGRGANAKAHNTYIHNLAGKPIKDTSHIGWHFTVDEDYIYQHIPLNENAWHCGDGSGPRSGNMMSVGIEICMHVDQKNYRQAEENAIALGRYLAQILSIPIANHVPHQYWSGKYCPQVILDRDKTFKPFYDRIVASIYTDNKLYRIKTGTFSTKEQANAAALKMQKNAITGIYHLQEDGKLWRVLTGTYRGRATAQAQLNRIVELGIVKVAHIEEPS